MLVLGLVLLLIGWLVAIPVLVILGLVLVVVGLVMIASAYSGHGRYWY